MSDKRETGKFFEVGDLSDCSAINRNIGRLEAEKQRILEARIAAAKCHDFYGALLKEHGIWEACSVAKSFNSRWFEGTEPANRLRIRLVDSNGISIEIYSEGITQDVVPNSQAVDFVLSEGIELRMSNRDSTSSSFQISDTEITKTDKFTLDDVTHRSIEEVDDPETIGDLSELAFYINRCLPTKV